MEQIEATLPLSINQAIDAYKQEQPIPLSTITVIQKALTEFLSKRGYLPPVKKRFRIKPANKGSGYTDTSINHNSVFAQSSQEMKQFYCDQKRFRRIVSTELK